MGGLEEKLEGILSDPHAMEQIMALARSLGEKKSVPDGQARERQEPSPPPSPPSGGKGDGLLSALSQVDPRLLAGAAQLMSQYNSGDDRRTALLTALRPFVQERRYARLDKAIQIAKLSRLIRMALELLRPQEEQHV